MLLTVEHCRAKLLPSRLKKRKKNRRNLTKCPFLLRNELHLRLLAQRLCVVDVFCKTASLRPDYESSESDVLREVTLRPRLPFGTDLRKSLSNCSPFFLSPSLFFSQRNPQLSRRSYARCRVKPPVSSLVAPRGRRNASGTKARSCASVHAGAQPGFGPKSR